MRWRSIGTAGAAIAAAAGLGIGGAALATAKEEPVSSVNGYSPTGNPGAASQSGSGLGGVPGEQGDVPLPSDCTAPPEGVQPAGPDPATPEASAPSGQDQALAGEAQSGVSTS